MRPCQNKPLIEQLRAMPTQKEQLASLRAQRMGDLPMDGDPLGRDKMLMQASMGWYRMHGAFCKSAPEAKRERLCSDKPPHNILRTALITSFDELDHSMDQYVMI